MSHTITCDTVCYYVVEKGHSEDYTETLLNPIRQIICLHDVIDLGIFEELKQNEHNLPPPSALRQLKYVKDIRLKATYNNSYCL